MNHSLATQVAPVSSAALRHGVSSGAVTSMNWGAWEYSVQCKRRLEIWHSAAEDPVGRAATD